jgi:hypothetical protein
MEVNLHEQEVPLAINEANLHVRRAVNIFIFVAAVYCVIVGITRLSVTVNNVRSSLCDLLLDFNCREVSREL